ncbi:amidohydrolase family protein [Nonomuraea sp. K274]|uniref:Amidohydrolase family protein n=1 Tax=Nonomuraea cypriaca TaxID=1187855 RepID=A0A931F2S1_9ACTN|nr:amidohydrolase family protein [Nonomuraea cypriaca]MBF8191825.1 amidohydrolase family protein [Nonomuraea cypriaca]
MSDGSGQGAGAVFYRAGGVFDGVSDGLRRGEGVLVADGRVVAVGPPSELAGRAGAEVDLGDRVIVPGFVDAHTHITIRPWEGDQHGKMMQPPVWQTVRGVQNLQRMIQSGVTTAKIMTEPFGIDYEFRDAVASGEVVGPRLRVCGPGLSPPGGHGSAAGGAVAGVADLRAAVAERAALGADHIKIFTTGGVSSTSGSLGDSLYSPEEIAAIVDEAAKHGMKVSAHAHGGPGVSYAVQNGIHSIEHGGKLDAENLALMAEHDTWLVMTHSILFHPEGIEGGDAHEPAILTKVREARAYGEDHVGNIRDAGIRIAVGTDSMHGLFGFELEWLVKHGWTPLEVLVAATSNGAALLGVDDLGVLREGARADLVVLDGDPLEDITAVYDVTAVYKDGAEIVQGRHLTPVPPAPRRHRPTPERTS